MASEDSKHSAQVIGVISDTHGLVRPSAIEALRGVDLILHAGDIGDKDVVLAVEQLAPVRLVRGNTDLQPWSRTLPETDVVEVGAHWLYMLHDLAALPLDPSAGGFSVVISGHSHKPRQTRLRGVLYFNPGSAGPRRFQLPISVGRLIIRDDHVEGELIRLEE